MNASPTSPAPGPIVLGFWPLARAFGRSFFLSAAANSERHQNIGFAYALAPVLEQLYPQPEARAEALTRHVGGFSTNPYMATALLGAWIRIEHAHAQGQPPPPTAQSILKSLESAAAALTDNFFWSRLRPFAFTFAILGLLLGVQWAPVAALALYNLFHFGVRLVGFLRGLRGQEATALLQGIKGLFHLHRYEALTVWGLSLCLGLIAALLTRPRILAALPLASDTALALFLAFTLIFYLCILRKIRTITLIYSSAAILLAYVLILNEHFPLIDP